MTADLEPVYKEIRDALFERWADAVMTLTLEPTRKNQSALAEAKAKLDEYQKKLDDYRAKKKGAE